MQPLFFGPQHRPLFGVFHPAASGRGRDAGVVICNPFGHEELHAHRSERHLAERLAAGGFATLRFDYDATGDSAGDDREEGRVKAWRESIALAVKELKARAEVSHVVLVGLRAGVLLALFAAHEVGVERLVLWNPVTSGRTHARELLRLHKMLFPKIKDDAGPRSAPRSGPRSVRHAMVLEDEEALGYALRKGTVHDLGKLDPLGLEAKPAAAALVIGGHDYPSEDKLLEKLRGLGVEVEYKHLPGHPFLVTDPHKSAVPVEMIDAVVDYLSAKYDPPPARSPSVPPPSQSASMPPSRGTVVTAGPAHEEAWLIGGLKPRFGILSVPKEAPKETAIVIMNAGSIHRVGPNRSFVRMARRWADLGYPVLRLDLSGIGDSPAAEGSEESLPYPPGAVHDAQAAMSALHDRGVAKRFILTGVCSGADIAFRTGVIDPRVAGAWMVNPQAFYFESSDALKAFMKADIAAQYYRSGLLDVDRWKRVIRGEVDLMRVATLLQAKVKTAVQRRAARILGVAAPSGGAPEARDVIADLRALASRGADTFLLCTEDDPGLLYLMKYFGQELNGLSDLPEFRKEIVRGPDHTFTPLWSQDMLSNLLTDHLLKKHP